jgi:putative transposase
MKELHNVCKVRKKRYRYISKISNKITPNLLKRDFKKDEPNIAWVTDVLEFRFNRKRLYLSVIQDLHNGEVKGYQISRSQNQDLNLKTLKKSSFTQSMSAKGNAYDNAVVESFFGTLKCETIYLQKVKSLSDLIRTIDEYIYWYNHDRIK